MSYQIDVNINASQLDEVASQMDNAANSVMKAATGLASMDLGIEDQSIIDDISKNLSIADINKLVSAIDKLSAISNNLKIDGKSGIDNTKILDNAKAVVSGKLSSNSPFSNPAEIKSYQKELEKLNTANFNLRQPKAENSSVANQVNQTIIDIFRSAKTIGNAGSKSEFGGAELLKIPTILENITKNADKGTFGDLTQLLRDSINQLSEISNILSIKGVQRIKNTIDSPINTFSELGKLIEIPAKLQRAEDLVVKSESKSDSRAEIEKIYSSLEGNEEAKLIKSKLRSNSSEKTKSEILIRLQTLCDTINAAEKIIEEVISTPSPSNVSFEVDYGTKKPEKEQVETKPTKTQFNWVKPKIDQVIRNVTEESVADFIQSIEKDNQKITLSQFKPISTINNGVEQLIRENLSVIPQIEKEIQNFESTIKQALPRKPKDSKFQFNPLNLEPVADTILDDFVKSINKEALKLTDKNFKDIFKSKVTNSADKLKDFFTPYAPVIPQSQKEIQIFDANEKQFNQRKPKNSKFQFNPLGLQEIQDDLTQDFITEIEKEALKLTNKNFKNTFGKIPNPNLEDFFKPYNKTKETSSFPTLSQEQFDNNLKPKDFSNKLEDFFKPYSPVITQSQKQIKSDGASLKQNLPIEPYISKFKWVKPVLDPIGNTILADFIKEIEKEALKISNNNFKDLFKPKDYGNKLESFFQPYKKEIVRDPKTQLSLETFQQQQTPAKNQLQNDAILNKITKAYQRQLEIAEYNNLTAQASTAFKIYNSLNQEKYPAPNEKSDDRFNQMINDISMGDIPLKRLKTVVTELIQSLENRLAEVSYPLPLQDFIIDGETEKSNLPPKEKLESKFKFNPNSIKPETDISDQILKVATDFISNIQAENDKIKNFSSLVNLPKQTEPEKEIQPGIWEMEFPSWWDESPIWTKTLPDWWLLDPIWGDELPTWWKSEVLTDTDKQKLITGILNNQKLLNPYRTGGELATQNNSKGELVKQFQDTELLDNVENKIDDFNEVFQELGEIIDAEVIETQKLLSAKKEYSDLENPWEQIAQNISDNKKSQVQLNGQLSLPGDIGSVTDPWSQISEEYLANYWNKVERQLALPGQLSLPADPNFIEDPFIDVQSEEIENNLKRLKPQIVSLKDFLENIDEKLELISRETILKLPTSLSSTKIQPNPWNGTSERDPWDVNLEKPEKNPQLLIEGQKGFQNSPWIEEETKEVNTHLLRLKPAVEDLGDFLANIDNQLASIIPLKPQVLRIMPLSGSTVRENLIIEKDKETDIYKEQYVKNIQEFTKNTWMEQLSPWELETKQDLKPKPQLLLNPEFGFQDSPWIAEEQEKSNTNLLRLKPALLDLNEYLEQIGLNLENTILLIPPLSGSSVRDKFSEDNLLKSPWENVPRNTPKDPWENLEKLIEPNKVLLLQAAFGSIIDPWFDLTQTVKSQIIKQNQLLLTGTSEKLLALPPSKEQNSPEEITIDIEVISKIVSTIKEAENGLEALEQSIEILNSTSEKTTKSNKKKSTEEKEQERSNKTSKKEKEETSTDASLIRQLIEEITLAIAKKDFEGAKELAGEGNLKSLDETKSEYQNIRIDKAEQKNIFDKANRVFDVIKNSVNSKISTAKDIGQVEPKELFGSNLDKITDTKKAELLVDKVNQWLLNSAEKFQENIDNEALSIAKKKAKLGTDSPLRNVPINGNNFLDVSITNNKESENQLKYQRRKLTAELQIAISTLGSEQQGLIKDVLNKIQEQRAKIKSPDILGSKETKDIEDLELNKLENKATNRIEGLKDSGGTTNALRDLQAAQASIKQFLGELKNLVVAFIDVSSAVNKEVIKLSVANNGNLTQTENDIRLATDSAKRFGGSVSGYLKDLAGIKIADQRTVDRTGSLSSNRYTDGDVKSLLSGLRSAYAVNQLNGEQQDGASNAVLQMLSKGKVQAEELRGQLGDRLNGAVNLFAQALGISTAQLDRRLKEGSILDLEVFKFGKLLEQSYSKQAEKATLIKETTAVQGNVKDFMTLATQPLAGVATVSAQFVNQMADGFKSNASLFTLASLPIGILIAQGISGGVANSFAKSQFVAPIVSALGASFKNNLGSLATVGTGLGVAVVASSVLGTTGLDQTISRLGNKIKDLIDVFSGFAKDGLKETNKIGKNVAVDAAFGILPLAAVISPITSYIANGLSPTFDRMRESFSGSNKFGSAVPNNKSFTTKIGDAIGTIDRASLGNAALAITTAVAAYAIANTTFISKYQKISEQLASDLSVKTKTDKNTFQQNITTQKEAEGTDKFNLDTFTTVLSDFVIDFKYNNGGRGQTQEQFNASLDQYTTARLEGIAKSNIYTDEQRQAASNKIQERTDKGYTPGQSNGIGTYAGRSAIDFLNKSDEQVTKLFGDLQRLTNTDNYKKDFNESRPTVEKYKQESQKLYRLQSEGGTQEEIDKQETIVKKLQTEARKATESITDAQLGISSKIKELEAQKTNLENSGFAGSKEKAKDIENYLEVLRAKLPEVNKVLESFSNPDQYISDRKQQLARQRNTIELQEIATKGQISDRRSSFVGQREKDGNDFSDPVRQAGLSRQESQINQSLAVQKYSIAKESRVLLSKATYSEENRAAYVEALKAEAEALTGVKEATFNAVSAKQNEKKAIEEFLQVTYDQKVRNFGNFKDSENYGVGKTARKGDVNDAILYGKLQKTQYELEKFKEILPKLTLNADAAKEKLRQLSDSVVLARLAYLEQTQTLISDRKFAERESVIDFSPYFDNQRDIQNKSVININRKQDELSFNQSQQKETKNALLTIQDPTERANLAIKLIGLETDEIRKKYELELAMLNLVKTKLDLLINGINSNITFSGNNAVRESDNQQYVKGRELEKRLSQASNPNGGMLTPLGENNERIELAKNNLNTLRAENERTYSDIINSFLTIEGTNKQVAIDIINDFKSKTSNQLKTDLALYDQQIRIAKEDPNRTSDQVDTVLGKGVNLNYATVLREAASQIQILKEKEQGLSASLGDLENQRTKMTNDIIRNTIDLKNSNNTATQELSKRKKDLTRNRQDFETGTSQTIQDKISGQTGKGKDFTGFLNVENIKFRNTMASAKEQLEIVSKEVQENLKVLQDRETAGASPEELKNLQEKIKAQNIRVQNAKLQVAETEQKGIESFVSNLMSFDSGLEILFENVSNKLKEAVDLLSQTIGQVNELGLSGQFNMNKIVQTKQVGYLDQNQQLKTRDVLEEFQYDSTKTGSQEEAKIRATVSKRNAEIDVKRQGLDYLSKNTSFLSSGSGIEESEAFKAANDNTKKIMLDAQAMIGQLGISTTDYKQNIEDITKTLDAATIDPTKLQIMINRSNELEFRKDNLETLDLQSTLYRNRDQRLQNRKGNTDMQRILEDNEPLVAEINTQRKKAKLEYDISQGDGKTDIQKTRGSLIYQDKMEDLDQQMKNLPAYGQRFVNRIEQAVENSANIGGVLEKAIEEGNWSNVLKDILSNIVKSLAQSYGQDAGKSASGLIGQAINFVGSIFGGSKSGASVSDGATGIGVLPSYSKGYNLGSDYPKTPYPDYREPEGKSHLAVIGRDEMVIPADKINAIISNERGMMASQNLQNNDNSTNTSNHTTNNYSFSSSGKKDSFNRPKIQDEIEEQRRLQNYQ